MMDRRFIKMCDSFPSVFEKFETLVFVLRFSGEPLYNEIIEIYKLGIHKIIKNTGVLNKVDLDIFSDTYMKNSKNIDNNKAAIIICSIVLGVVIEHECLKEAKRIGIQGIKVKKCERCYKYFLVKGNYRKYCSPTCRDNK